MKPPASEVRTVSTVASGARPLGVSAEGLATVLTILSNMYSDGEYAVVREYSTNALDAHVEAGNPDPILVISPSHFNPVFTVQDFGTGLSEDEVLNVYAEYGVSTKRGTDEQIGFFGIGAKSAFTVGTQFVVTAVKDGMETVALFALNDDGTPTVNIVSHQETLEPDGVKVEVGVKNVDAMNAAIKRLFPTWPRGSVLVDGIEPVSVWDELDPLADDIHMSIGSRAGAFIGHGIAEAWTIVMGGIPYTLPESVVASLKGHHRQIVYNVQRSRAKVYLSVPIGGVDITPSREDLRVTPKTTAALEVLIGKFHEKIGPWVSRQVSDSKSYIEALLRYRKITADLGGVIRNTATGVTWRGRPLVVGAVELRDTEWYSLSYKRGGNGERTARRKTGMTFGPGKEAERTVFVTGVPERRVRTVQRSAKGFLLAESRKEGGAIWVVSLTKPEASYTTGWFDLSDPALAKIDFDTFTKDWKPVTVPAQRGATRYVLADGSGRVTADELNDMAQEGDILYLEWGERNLAQRGQPGGHSPLYHKVTNGHTVVILKASQKASVLIKRVPGADWVTRRMDALAEKILASLTVEDYDTNVAQAFIATSNGMVAEFLTRHRARITNPAVLRGLDERARAEALASSTMSLAGRERASQVAQAARRTGRNLLSDGKSSFDMAAWNKIKDGLPLLIAYTHPYHHADSPAGDKHAILYVNSTVI
jgi:Histidine kinase-, DNA gyrase B-, and HSP90-like ATPase